MRKHLFAVGIAATVSSGLSYAQPATSQPVLNPIQPASPAPPMIVSQAPGAPGECCLLAKLTPVFLTIDEPVESDKAKIGQSFRLKLSQPLSLAGGITIPAGTAGVGEVVHAAKSRAMGKAGELVLAARYLDYQGIRIPLRSLRYGKGQGKDNVDSAFWVGIAVSGLITPFITGGEVRIPAGAYVWAKIAADIAIPRPLPAAPAAPAQVSQVPTQGVN